MGMTKPLEGIKVVELSTYVAVPACGRMLADMGARVVKVESPKGDVWRIHGANNGIRSDEGENPLFDLFNSGKECIALDLKNPSGMEVFHRLLGEADVFLSNTRMKSLVKLGLGWEEMHRRYPGLVYATLSGFGEKGPEAQSPGFDSVAFWAKTGFLADMTVRGENSVPVQHPTSVGDTATGALLLGGILAALLQREKTGRGERISTSLYSAAIWYMGCMVVMAQDKYGPTYPKSREEGGAFRAQFRCADGEWIMVMILDEAKYAQAYFEALGRGDLLSDPRFATVQARRSSKRELFQVVEPIFARRTSGEWLAELEKRDIPCTRLNHFRDIADSEQAWVNQYIEYEAFPDGGRAVVPCPPIRFGEEVCHTAPARLLGEDTVRVLEHLHYSDAEIRGFLDQGAALGHLRGGGA